ncbi:hypothetical protein [Achromobacter agilis]|uniref:Uncharacterized protein n=1 Tax=Achromobacter agilis TaxID=1353888 RepID=A0A446CQ27_9BURK|nr:hypothetical protein [Achromobacter agilis]SSW69990.1 hypothetical protein AGI3411_04440 [Achromobacter agilis]
MLKHTRLKLMLVHPFNRSPERRPTSKEQMSRTTFSDPAKLVELETLLTEAAFPNLVRQPMPLASRTAKQQAQKDERLQALMDSCRTEVIQQIIGPFGLTPAMFDDIDGGNVTTQHNADQDIYAKKSEEYARTDYDYATAKSKKLKSAVESGEMNSQEFTDAYTGQKAPTKRTTANGKMVMNAELDHSIPLKQAHKEGGWMLDKEHRKALASEKDNLNYTTFENNRAKSDIAAEEALSEQNGYDKARTQPIIDKAREAVDNHLPNTGDRIVYHGRELGATGAREFGKAGLRRAFGVLLHEFVNGSFQETQLAFNQRHSEETLLNRFLAAIERVLKRVQGKFKQALDEFFKGGLQGFISNLLTFLINNLVTTSAKVVTIIREGMHKLWDALKMLLWPPQDLPASEMMRAVTKSIAGLFTLGAGMLWEQSINAFLLSIPVLAPVAGLIAPVLTGLLTGLGTALLMYGIDSIIDWMLDKGTAMLDAQIDTLQAQSELIASLAAQMDVQCQLNAGYRQLIGNHQQVASHFHTAERHVVAAQLHAESAVTDQRDTVATLNRAIDARLRLNQRLNTLLKR